MSLGAALRRERTWTPLDGYHVTDGRHKGPRCQWDAFSCGSECEPGCAGHQCPALATYVGARFIWWCEEHYRRRKWDAEHPTRFPPPTIVG